MGCYMPPLNCLASTNSNTLSKFNIACSRTWQWNPSQWGKPSWKDKSEGHVVVWVKVIWVRLWRSWHRSLDGWGWVGWRWFWSKVVDLVGGGVSGCVVWLISMGEGRIGDGGALGFWGMKSCWCFHFYFLKVVRI